MIEKGTIYNKKNATESFTQEARNKVSVRVKC